ncbi:MAG: hypothetical protein ABH842_02395 [Candidatus Micrarchaeota archaeon]
MSKYKSMSYMFVLLTILLIFVFVYLSSDYVNSMLNAIIDFLNKNGISNLQECGILLPPDLTHLNADLNVIILPFLYYGLPIFFVMISLLMFLAGFYYHKGKIDEHAKAEDQLKRAVVHRLVKKMEKEKAKPRK